MWNIEIWHFSGLLQKILLHPNGDAMSSTAHGLVGCIVWQAIAVSLVSACVIVTAMTLGRLFDYEVYKPYKARAHFENTCVFVFPRWLDTIVTWCYVQQNYHGVHHAFPRIPFMRYRDFFVQQKKIL